MNVAPAVLPTTLAAAVVVTYNSAPWISTCLGALAGMRTIVVDNASHDETLAIVRTQFPEVQVVAHSGNRGFAVAVNAGARQVPDADILLVNPDLVVRPGSVAALEQYMAAHPRVGIVVPRLVYPDGSPQASIRTFPSPLTMLARRSPFGQTPPGRAILRRHLRLDDPPTLAGAIHWGLGAAMLVRRQAIRDVGGMDERIFLYGEDVDWCYRMWQAGWEVHVEPAAVMGHAYERQSRRTLDLRSAATRHHWASVFKLFALHPSLLLGRGPRPAREAIRRA